MIILDIVGDTNRDVFITHSAYSTASVYSTRTFSDAYRVFGRIAYPPEAREAFKKLYQLIKQMVWWRYSAIRSRIRWMEWTCSTCCCSRNSKQQMKMRRVSLKRWRTLTGCVLKYNASWCIVVGRLCTMLPLSSCSGRLAASAQVWGGLICQKIWVIIQHSCRQKLGLHCAVAPWNCNCILTFLNITDMISDSHDKLY